MRERELSPSRPSAQAPEFDLVQFRADLEAIHPGAHTIETSARTGEGVAEFGDWLAG